MVLYHLVRRWFGEPAAVLAALGFALTPVAVVMFRFNDPDAFLTLLLVLAAWACWHAIESGNTSGLVLSGALLGLAFLTKTLDAFIVLPALGLAYLCCGPPQLARRIGQLGWGALALFVSSGWWVAVVELWPKSARPYIGGSTNNSELNLIFGYNGFARISGSHRYWAVAGGQGLLRMFNTELGGQIAWFLPLAIVGVLGGFCLTRGRQRTDRERAGFVLWGSVFLTYFAVFDDARGIFHPYYTVVIAPAVAALAGSGTVALWRLGQQVAPLGMGVAAGHRWQRVVGGRSPRPHRWVRPLARTHGDHYRDCCRACLAPLRDPATQGPMVCGRGRRRGGGIGARRSFGLLDDHRWQRHAAPPRPQAPWAEISLLDVGSHAVVSHRTR